MSKKTYAVIGHPINHTMSPFIHKKLFQLAGIDADYTALDISAQDISTRISELRALDGYNVTIPNKQAIIHFLDKLSRKAKFHGSVNTVKNGDFSEGHTTDAEGFLQSLKLNNITLGGKTVILGAGGVARTLAYELVVKGIDTTVAVRPSGLIAASNLACDIKEDIPNMDISTCIIERLSGPIDLLINATPVGMHPNIDEIPLPESIIKNCAAVFDVVYNPVETKLLKIAKANGASVVGGTDMLVLQAVKAHEIWNGSTFSQQSILDLIQQTKSQILKDFPL